MPLLAALAAFPWHPWHVALALAALSAILFVVARAQLQRARDDWANAYFYSPSQKPKARQRRQRWQDVTWATLGIAVAFALATIVLYLRGPR